MSNDFNVGSVNGTGGTSGSTSGDALGGALGGLPVYPNINVTTNGSNFTF